MYEILRTLDRRWVFLLMFLAIATPILLRVTFPEKPSNMVNDVFAAIDRLPEGSKVLMAWDFDPGSRGELEPMASAFTRHCAEKKLKMYYMALWPLAVPMIQDSVRILEKEYPNLKYGRDYVNLGYKPGNEGVIKVVVTNMRKLYTTDHYGTGVETIPMLDGVTNVQAMDLIINVSAGDPGTKQWVQYVCTPFGKRMVAGCTGVQAPQLYPYIPAQLIGILGAIKAAAEYEQALLDAYPHLASIPTAKEGLRRMGPQLVGHVLIVLLVIVANVIYFIGRRRGDTR